VAEHIQTVVRAVVSEDPAVLQEGMGVNNLVGSGGRVADMRDKGSAG
jgi:hypothetical protein